MIYKINNQETLEGSPEQIIEILLNHHRDHLYKTDVIKIYDEFNDVTYQYYKSKTNFCPECGTVHGHTIQLVPQYCEDFSKLYTKKPCPLCAAKVKLEVRPWCKEFLVDNHELASS
jgi:endogenous inhibitor of DNA gyrase (YacG/DUF329 family)